MSLDESKKEETKKLEITRNKEYNNSSIKTNEVLDEENEELSNKKPDGNIEELKDNKKKSVEIKLWSIKSMEVMSRKKERL